MDRLPPARLAELPGIRGGTRNFGPPFLGLFEAIRSWLDHPLELFMSVVLLAVALILARWTDLTLTIALWLLAVGLVPGHWKRRHRSSRAPEATG